MSPQPTPDLRALAWPLSRLHEAVSALVKKAGLPARLEEIPEFPQTLEYLDVEVLGQWMEVAAERLGIEAEAVESSYADIEAMVGQAAPALILLPGGDLPRFLVLLKGGRRKLAIITPELRVRDVRLETIRNALTHEVEEPLFAPIQKLLVEADVPEDRRDNVQTAILREQLSENRIGGCWLLRMSPGAGFWKQIRHARLPRYLLTIIGATLIGQMFILFGWWAIGRGALEGHFDRAWLLAWALVLFTAIPFQLVNEWTQNLLSLRLGGLFKQRLLYGILQLEPEEIRHQGAGQFLGIVMESEALESLALGLGFTVIVAVVQLFITVGVLSMGAGGWRHALLLVAWMVLTAVICWYYYRYTKDWVVTYREMTNDLVERMVGHRTRLAQEDREHWHDEEDKLLNRYVKLSERLDRIGIVIQAVIGRGWLIVGLLGLVSAFILTPKITASIAISLGGILLASQSLGLLVAGIISFAGVVIAWKQVGPLFQAAERPRARQTTPRMLPAVLDRYASADDRPVVTARDLDFRYRESGPLVLRTCSLQIDKGQRLLLEGPSGGGKSTFSALLAALRIPESGDVRLWGVAREMVGDETWRRRVVTAPQFHENHVLTETFAFNLLMGRRWPALPEDLQEAEQICRELGLGELLDRMPAGFQQMVGESGWQLSHGERSRLYIARALLQKADLIILDESFAALDPENLQRALQCVLRRAPTLLVIAHP